MVTQGKIVQFNHKLYISLCLCCHGFLKKIHSYQISINIHEDSGKEMAVIY